MAVTNLPKPPAKMVKKLTKREGGYDYSARHFLDVPDPKSPTTWSLRIYEIVNGKPTITRAQLARAAQALSSTGFMGNPYKLQTESGGKTKDQLKKVLVSRYRQLGVPDEEIPKHLLSAAHGVTLNRKEKLPKEEKFLIHYGVKGMKWGIRKDYRTGGQKTVAKAKSLSDEQLRSRVKRMQLESQYRDLVNKENKANQTRLEGGKQRVEKALKEAGQETLKNVFAKSMGIGIDVATDLGSKQIAKNPTGKILLDLTSKKK